MGTQKHQNRSVANNWVREEGVIEQQGIRADKVNTGAEENCQQKGRRGGGRPAATEQKKGKRVWLTSPALGTEASRKK